MRRIAPLLCLAATVAMSAQTAPKSSNPSKASTSSKTSTAAGKTTTGRTSAAGYKLPADEKRVSGIPHTAFALKYQNIKVGTGPEGEAGKLWHVKYKGWRAADGVVFDNWEEHKRPVMDKDGKPEMGEDGKPKMGDPEPLVFPQGMGRLIPGFDYGVTGMRVGSKRRLFIPWEMAYGTRSIPDRPDHPGIPAKSDLIFDVELVEVTDMPTAPQRPMAPPAEEHPQSSQPPTGSAPGTPPPGGQQEKPGTPAQPSQPSTPPPPPPAR